MAPQEIEERLAKIEAAIDELSSKLTANFEADQAQLARVEALSKRNAVSVDKQTVVLFVITALVGFLIVQGKLSGEGVDTSLLEILVPIIISLLAGTAFLPKKG